MVPRPPGEGTPPSRERPKGQSFPLSGPRRLIGDLLHFASKVPSVPVQRRMNLGPVQAMRARLIDRPSWVALFLKGYSQVAAEIPVLRRAYLTFPWAHLYEHPENVCTVAVERIVDGEEAVFFAHLRSPENTPLPELTDHLRRFKEAPLHSISAFRLALRWSRVPGWLRRMAWWWGLNGSGDRRARRFGTFGVSVYSGLGVESLHPISPLTTVLNYGPIAPSGLVDVRLIYDHRVLDGSTVGRALIRLEEKMNGPILAELESLCPPNRGALSA